MKKSWLVLIPIFILSLFQGAFLPLNLVLLLLVFWTAFRPPREGLLVAFLSGLLLDLSLGTTLGLSSLVLLAVAFILLLYRPRFDFFHPFFLPPFVFFASLFYDFLLTRHWSLVGALVLAILSLILRFLFVFLGARVDRHQLKLS